MQGKIQPTQGRIDERSDLISHRSDYSLLHIHKWRLIIAIF